MRPSVSKLKARLSQCVRRRREIQAAYLFGSVVTGRMRPDSDIDVAVLVHPGASRIKAVDYRLRLAGEISRALSCANLDLILLNEANPVLTHQVISKGVLAFERSHRERVAFQVRALNHYLDTEPMRALYRHYLKKRIREGQIFG
jgi:predicted nucleotidyltransferase